LTIVFDRNKLEFDYDELNQTEQIETQLENLQRSINELEAWHTRTSSSKWILLFLYSNIHRI